jgi:lipopolysaccharide transport system ATP-binding protein
VMSDVAIRAEGLSKRYRIGGPRAPYKTIRETMINAAATPLRRARAVLRGESATESKDTIWALKDVSFEVKHGEVLGIIGPNGAGKTTLLKVLSRITKPTEGYAEVRGLVGSLLEVGTGFHPELTGRENVYLNGAILGMRKVEIAQRFDEIVAFAEIDKFIDTPVKFYSSGMYVRLAFAVAAHLEPEILLVDEVLAVGDAAFQKKCLGKMGEVSRQGRTVLFVSHNMAAVNAMCARATLLDYGAVVAEGKASAVTELYLARQLGSPSDAGGVGYQVNERVLSQQCKDGLEIEAVELVNPARPEAGARTGDPLLVRLTYCAHRNFISPAFVVKLRDVHGQELVRLSTTPISGYHIDSVYPRGSVELLIESLPFVAGRYVLDVGFVRELIEWIVRLDGVITFDVQPCDVYGSGLALTRSRGILVVEHTWNHTNLEQIG